MENKRHTVKEWIAVTRYWSFPVSAMPVIVTFTYLFSRHLVTEGTASIVNLVLALVGAVVLHSAGNVLSDWSDYRSGVDNENAFAVPNLVFHRFTPRQYLTFSIILFIAGCIIGLVLALRTGWPLLIIGGAGVLLTILYSFLKYRAMGDIDIFLIFSVLIILGTTYVVTGSILWETLVLAPSIGIITVSVLHANNTIDIRSDGEAGIHTLAMALGGLRSSRLYMAYMVIPFVWILFAVICGWIHPMSLISMFAALPALQNFKAASHYSEKGPDTMAGLDKASAQLQLTFSALLALGLFISVIF